MCSIEDNPEHQCQPRGLLCVSRHSKPRITKPALCPGYTLNKISLNPNMINPCDYYFVPSCTTSSWKIQPPNSSLGSCQYKHKEKHVCFKQRLRNILYMQRGSDKHFQSSNLQTYDFKTKLIGGLTLELRTLQCEKCHICAMCVLITILILLNKQRQHFVAP